MTAKAEDILGFRAEQFRQVVMLPQGRFQQFLEADSGQREQILRALFETGRYADIERALHDEALALKRSAEKIAERRDEVLRNAEVDDAETLADRCARLAVDYTEASQHAEQAERDDAAAQQALAGGREAARQLKERDDAAAEVAALAARDAEIQARRSGTRGRPARRRGRRRGATGRRGRGALRRGPHGGRRRRRGGRRRPRLRSPPPEERSRPRPRARASASMPRPK